MRFEFTCICEATVAIEHDIETGEDIMLLQNLYENQIAMHVANCRKALMNYPLKEVTTNE